MPDVVFMFEVHQPYRLRDNILLHLIKGSFKQFSGERSLHSILFDEELNRSIFERVASRCYIPATKILIEVNRRLRENGRPFKFSLSISGVFIEQALKWNRVVIDVISEAVSEGIAELVDQTYYHSLASLFPEYDEFIEQVTMHRGLLHDIFGVNPIVAENTEFIYNNSIAHLFAKLGYKVILTEGAEQVLGWRSPNYVYRAWGSDARVLLRNYRLSDDIGFRFSDKKWDQYPLTAEKYAKWLSRTHGDVVLIAIDYETFGEHHSIDTGIHEFLRWLPVEISKHHNIVTEFPSTAAFKHPVKDVYNVQPWNTISWADERDLSAWLGNEMQKTIFEFYTFLEPYARAVGGEYLKIWRMLGSSDHLYYISVKGGAAGEVHAYFSPYKDVSTALRVYTEAITVLTSMISNKIAENPRRYAYNIVLPSLYAFHFYLMPGKPLNLKVRSIPELATILEKVPIESIIYHLRRGDLANWIKHFFFMDEVALQLEELTMSIDSIDNYEKLREIVVSILHKYEQQ
ncbi:MAG: alpha-amylase [Ignisphaera sp.]|nr:alpha-amylase [Ignisphaera sp.]MCX8167787.1 alpha-amylase [Ignisphaera sp.]MDW8085226.1 alpha-amylase [Ignisphaera sp.]